MAHHEFPLFVDSLKNPCEHISLAHPGWVIDFSYGDPEMPEDCQSQRVEAMYLLSNLLGSKD